MKVQEAKNRKFVTIVEKNAILRDFFPVLRNITITKICPSNRGKEGTSGVNISEEYNEALMVSTTQKDETWILDSGCFFFRMTPLENGQKIYEPMQEVK